jgi:hypothetical protein
MASFIRHFRTEHTKINTLQTFRVNFQEINIRRRSYVQIPTNSFRTDVDFIPSLLYDNQERKWQMTKTEISVFKKSVPKVPLPPFYLQDVQNSYSKIVYLFHSYLSQETAKHILVHNLLYNV